MARVVLLIALRKCKLSHDAIERKVIIIDWKLLRRVVSVYVCLENQGVRIVLSTDHCLSVSVSNRMTLRNWTGLKIISTPNGRQGRGTHHSVWVQILAGFCLSPRRISVIATGSDQPQLVSNGYPIGNFVLPTRGN